MGGVSAEQPPLAKVSLCPGGPQVNSGRLAGGGFGGMEGGRGLGGGRRQVADVCLEKSIISDINLKTVSGRKKKLLKSSSLNLSGDPTTTD